MIDNPIYPEGETPLILLGASVLMVASVIPVAFSPSNFGPLAASGPGGLLYSLGQYAFSQLAILVNAGTQGIKYASQYAWLLALLALTLQGCVILNTYDNVIYQKLDKGTNKYLLPAYRNTALPIAKFGSVVFNAGVCWADLYIMAEKLAIIDTVKVLVDCSEQDWQGVVNDTLVFVGYTLAIPAYFIQADGKEEFQFTPALLALQAAINNTRPSFECMCEELDFFFNILFGVLGDPNLAYAINAGANNGIYYPLNITVQALVEAFSNGGAAYNCNQENTTLRIDCAIHRPPYFIPLRDSMCNSSVFIAAYLQDAVNLIIHQFIDYDGNVLVFEDMMSSFFCFVYSLLVDTLDLLSRPDMVFDPQVQYLRIWAFNNLPSVGYEFAEGIELFFAAFNDFYTDQIGMIFSNMVRLLVNLANTVVQFFIAVFYTIYTPNSVITFFQDFNSTQFEVPYYAMKGAIFNITNAIDTYFSDSVMQGFTTGEDSFKFIYAIIRFFAQDPSFDQVETWIITIAPNYTDTIAIDIHAQFVTIANFFRQFDNTCPISPFQPPIIDNIANIDSHTVCQLADIVETIGQWIRSYVIQMSTTFYQLEYNLAHGIPISGYGPFLQSFANWINGEVLIILNNAIDSLAGMIGSLFQDIQCPCVANQCSSGNEGLSSTNVRDNVTLYGESVLNAIIGNIYYLVAFWINVMLEAVNLIGDFNLPALEQLLCTVVTDYVDILGRFVDVFKRFCDFLDCLLGTPDFHINVFSGTIYYVIFDPSNTGSVRNQLCTVIDEAIEAIQFFVGLITGGFGYLGTLIASGGATAVNDIVAVINANLVSALNNTINVLVGAVRSVVCFINRIIGIFTCLTSINITTNVPPPISIPGFSTQPIFINLGLFSFTIPGFSINIPSFTIPIPIPDFSTITSAISCLSNNFNAFSNGGCENTCGPSTPGGIMPSFCTNSYTVPPVPFVSVPPTSRKRNEPDINFNKRTPLEFSFASTEHEEEYIRQYRANNHFPDYGEFQYETAQDSTYIIGLSNDTYYQDVYYNYTMLICGNYYNLTQDESLSVNLRAFFVEQFTQCATSAQMSYIVNKAIFQNDTEDWLGPMMFSSVGQFTLNMFSLFTKVFPPFVNELACYGAYVESQIDPNMTGFKNNCMNWNQYYAKHNFTSPFMYKLGNFLQDMRLNMTWSWLNSTEYGFTNFFSGVWNLVTGIYNLVYSIKPGLSNSLADSVQMSYHAYTNTLMNTTVRSFFSDHISPVLQLEERGIKRWENKNTFGFNLTASVYRGLDRLSVFYNEKKGNISQFLEAKSLRTKRNRGTLFYFHGIISSMYKEYMYRRGLYRDKDLEDEYLAERNLPMLYSATTLDISKIKTIDDAFYAWQYSTLLGRDKLLEHMKHHINITTNKRQATLLPPNILPPNNSDICGIPVPGGTTCINCTILKVLLDDFISRVLECVFVSQNPINLLENRYFLPFIQLIANPFSRMNSQTSGVFQEWVDVHLGQNFSAIVHKYEKQNFNEISEVAQEGPDFGFLVTPIQVLANLFDGWIQSLAADILDIEFSFELFLTNARVYITTDTAALGNSLYGWAANYFNTPVSMDCVQLAERGIGIGNLPLTAGLVTLVMIGIVTLLARVNSTLLSAFIPVVLMWPALVLMINYGISPFQLPAVPFCLGDDIFEILTVGDVDCIPITNLLNNITDTNCPGTDTDFERPFILCSESPYYFNNPWRLLFFGLDYVSPYWANQLRYSNNYVFSLIRQINGMEEMMTFPYPAGQPTGQFSSCFFTRLPNASVFGVYLTGLTAAAAVAALSAVTAVTFLASFIYALGLTCMFFAMLINGTGFAPTNNSQPPMKDSTDYLTQNLQGSDAYEHTKIQELETQLGISFAESEKKKMAKNLRKRSELQKVALGYAVPKYNKRKMS